MKKAIYLFVLAFMGLTFMHCGHGSGDPDSMEKIVLNQGEKWIVDAPMMVELRAMEKAVQNFRANDQAGYQQLAEVLSEYIGTLTAKCTMKGQGHDELHKWLLPFIGMVKNLSEHSDIVDSEVEYGKIKEAFIILNKYFE